MAMLVIELVVLSCDRTEPHTNGKKPKEVGRVKALKIDYGRSLCADKDFPPYHAYSFDVCARSEHTEHSPQCILHLGKCIDGVWLLGNCMLVLYIERL